MDVPAEVAILVAGGTVPVDGSVVPGTIAGRTVPGDGSVVPGTIAGRTVPWGWLSCTWNYSW